MPARFYAPDARGTSEPVELPREEAAHLVRVLRLGVGAEVSVFDGLGHEWRARVESVGKRGAAVSLLDSIAPRPEPTVRLTFAPSVLKADKLDAVIRDATALGVCGIYPVISARSETTSAVLTRSKRAHRWQRIAVAAAKQCGRAVVPTIHEPKRLEEFLEREPVQEGHVRLIMVEPLGTVGPPIGVSEYQHHHPGPPRTATVLVGPEGGWTPSEVALAVRCGFLPMTLSARTFRAEAVPLIAIALLQFVWGDL